MHNNLRLL